MFHAKQVLEIMFFNSDFKIAPKHALRRGILINKIIVILTAGVIKFRLKQLGTTITFKNSIKSECTINVRLINFTYV
jgi:hypothetical protein